MTISTCGADLVAALVFAVLTDAPVGPLLEGRSAVAVADAEALLGGFGTEAAREALVALRGVERVAG